MCFVQEYIDAPCLDPELGYESKEINLIARQALDILCYLQSQTPIIVHRDIKPENLLWSQNKKLYLIDFGLARNSRTNSEAASSILAGTLGFMPPEQLLGRTPNSSSDLYSLGITLVVYY
ncbi:MAG: protein kinase [Hydrococcus sp. RM1_1_31]|nr:protein kinase [Hydrococcus sp. RM1_1_31]